MTDRREIETLLREAGIAISLLAGKCAFSERVLCKVATLCVELLAEADDKPCAARLCNEGRPAPRTCERCGLGPCPLGEVRRELP